MSNNYSYKLTLSMETEKAFEILMKKTHCPFAAKSKVDYSPDWNKDLSIAENVKDLMPSFIEFEKTAESRKVDMYVLGINDNHALSSIEAAAKSLGTILHTIRENDPLNPVDLIANIETLAWNFRFGNTDFFVPLFAPFYPPSNPRFSHHNEYGFLLFQPDHSFSRHNISKKNPNRYKVSTSIRDAFEEELTPYDLNLVVGTPKAIRYIKPMHIGDPIVEWWK